MRCHLYYLTLLPLILLGLAKPASADILEPQKLQYNKQHMFDKFLLGAFASYQIPLGQYGKEVKGAIGGGISGKYFGTDFFALGFDLGFFAPKFKAANLIKKQEILQTSLELSQRRRLVPDSVLINGLTGQSQLIPINLTFEFYLPKQALKNFRPYAALGIGVQFVNRRYEPSYSVPLNNALQQVTNRAEISKSAAYFSLSPVIGFIASFNELWNINVDVRYTYMFGDLRGSSLSVNFGLLFNLASKYD